MPTKKSNIKRVPPRQDMHRRNNRKKKMYKLSERTIVFMLTFMLDSRNTNGIPIKVLSGGRISQMWYCSGSSRLHFWVNTVAQCVLLILITTNVEIDNAYTLHLRGQVKMYHLSSIDIFPSNETSSSFSKKKGSSRLFLHFDVVCVPMSMEGHNTSNEVIELWPYVALNNLSTNHKQTIIT
jgi:hypothetical protein